MLLSKRGLLICSLLLAGAFSGEALSAESSAVRQVTVQPLAKLVVYPRNSAPAQVVSLNESRISAEVAAAVKSVPVRVGDHVDKGQQLVTLECDDLLLRKRQAESSLQSAEARLEFAKSQVKRSESLRGSNNLSEELMQQRHTDLKSAEADRSSAEANVRAAELNVARCNITAPFAGVVLQRLVSEGEWVSAGTPLVTLLDSQRLEVSAQIETEEVNGLRHAKSVEFVAEGDAYPVTLHAMVDKIDPKLRQREVRLNFTGKRPLPGQVGRLEWQSDTPHLPADLPVRREGRLGLFVVKQGHAQFIPLPDAIEGRLAPVPALSQEAELVIEGRQSLHDGDVIKVVK